MMWLILASVALLLAAVVGAGILATHTFHLAEHDKRIAVLERKVKQ